MMRCSRRWRSRPPLWCFCSLRRSPSRCRRQSAHVVARWHLSLLDARAWPARWSSGDRHGSRHDGRRSNAGTYRQGDRAGRGRGCDCRRAERLSKPESRWSRIRWLRSVKSPYGRWIPSRARARVERELDACSVMWRDRCSWRLRMRRSGGQRRMLGRLGDLARTWHLDRSSAGVSATIRRF